MNWSLLAFVFVGMYSATVIAGAINNVAGQLLAISFDLGHKTIKVDVRQPTP